MTLPLDGLVVADFSRVLAGPLATATLADLGARVIKVERPGSGDDTRAWGPPWTESSSAYFESCNRSKESVVLDLADPHDAALARELATRADVLVENFRTGTMARHGLDRASLAAANPGLVHCSITGFGSGGGAHLAGYDFLVQAVGGLMSITGEADGPATKVGVALVDVLTAKDATVGILAALHARHRTGQGQQVEVNLLSSLLAALANQGANFLTTGESPGRIGNRHPSIAPYESLRCADTHVAVACGNDQQFRRLAATLGDPSLADDPRFSTNPARVAHRDDLVAALETLLSSRTAQSWADALGAAGVPAGTVASIAEGIALADRLGLAPVVDVGDQNPGQIRSPLILSATPITRYAPPPTLGQHSDSIRTWLNAESRNPA